MARKLVVEIVGDSSALERSFAKSTKAANQFDRQVTGTFTHVDAGFTRLQKVAGGALLGGAALAGIKSSLEAASDLREQVSKVGQVFGDASDATVAWSQTTANAFGVSQRAALTAAGTFGNLFNTVGLAPQKAAEMSRSLVELAADLASFNNVDPTDALDALRSGLIGEAEPLRRFGVLLSETRVQQQAMADTGKTTAASLTDQEKALARYTLILKDTAPAQGDFARTSDGAANASRRLSANLADLQANLSSGLVPALAKVTGGLADLTAAMRTTQITAAQLASDKGLRDKFADAFGAKALFDTLNGITSAGLQTRPDEGASRAGADAGKKTGSAIGDAFAKALEGAMGAAKSQVREAIAKGQDAIDKAAAAEARQKAAQARSDAFAKLIGNLSLGVDKAGLTKQLGDDIRALEALKAGLQQQIKAGVDVQAAQTQLVSVLGQIASKQDDVREAAAAAEAKAAQSRQVDQFRALGLDAQGNKPPPAIANLKKQLAQLSSRDDLTGNQKGLLDRIRKVLVDPVKKATPETREAIKNLFDMIRGTFKDEMAKTSQQQLKRIQVSDRVLKALGLDKDPSVARFNSQAAASMAAPRLRATPTGSTATGGVTISGPITVVADNPDAFLRELQKKARRTSATASGRFPGRSLGLG